MALSWVYIAHLLQQTTQLLTGVNTCLPALLAFAPCSQPPWLTTAAKWVKLTLIAVLPVSVLPSMAYRRTQQDWKMTFLHTFLSISIDRPRIGNLVSLGTLSVYSGVSAKEESAIPATHLQWSALAGGKYSWVGKLPEFIQEESPENGNKGDSLSLEHFRVCYVLDSSGKLRNR